MLDMQGGLCGLPMSSNRKEWDMCLPPKPLCVHFKTKITQTYKE